MTPNGMKLCNFDIAVNESYKDGDGNRKETVEFIKCVAFKQHAQLLEDYTEKGGRVFISGKYSTNSWEDTDGVTRYKTQIIVQKIVLLSFKDKNYEAWSEPQESQEPKKTYQPQENQRWAPDPTKKKEVEEISIDDLPF